MPVLESIDPCVCTFNFPSLLTHYTSPRRRAFHPSLPLRLYESRRYGTATDSDSSCLSRNLWDNLKELLIHILSNKPLDYLWKPVTQSLGYITDADNLHG